MYKAFLFIIGVNGRRKTQTLGVKRALKEAWCQGINLEINSLSLTLEVKGTYNLLKEVDIFGHNLVRLGGLGCFLLVNEYTLN